MNPLGCVKYKLKKVDDCTPSDEELEIIGGEVTNEERDDKEKEQEENNLDENRSGNMNVVDDAVERDEAEAPGDLADAAVSLPVQESETTCLDPKIKADLECLSRIGSVADTDKKQSSVQLLLFLVKVENVLTKKRRQCKAQTEMIL